MCYLFTHTPKQGRRACSFIQAWSRNGREALIATCPLYSELVTLGTPALSPASLALPPRQVYMIFTHIYTGEHSSEVLDWMGLEAVSEAVRPLHGGYTAVTRR